MRKGTAIALLSADLPSRSQMEAAISAGTVHEWHGEWTLLSFEFDPLKSAANKAKHGIDFVEAQALWLDPDRIDTPGAADERAALHPQ
ncbi:MAG TPA: BrnT family toxin [Vicinamibacterales bacterium]|nr:BrnT family toxin [Vicinamibacterales bacterium]